jgi:hypothetical protein
MFSAELHSYHKNLTIPYEKKDKMATPAIIIGLNRIVLSNRPFKINFRTTDFIADKKYFYICTLKRRDKK